jgi:hypothetical protein
MKYPSVLVRVNKDADTSITRNYQYQPFTTLSLKRLKRIFFYRPTAIPHFQDMTFKYKALGHPVARQVELIQKTEACRLREVNFEPPKKSVFAL